MSARCLLFNHHIRMLSPLKPHHTDTSSLVAHSPLCNLCRYEKARKLKDFIGGIRDTYTRNWEARDRAERQVGSCREAATVPPLNGQPAGCPFKEPGCCLPLARCKHATPRVPLFVLMLSWCCC
jgi:hypothetical protein